MAKVHLATRRQAYAGLLPTAVLDGMTEAALEAWWAQRLASAPEPHRLLLAVDRPAPGRLLGFAHVGSEGGLGLLHAIHVDPEAQGRRVGAALLAAAVSELRGFGCTRGRLWVLAGNTRAQGFYRRQGWAQAPGLSRREDIDGCVVDEIAYERDLHLDLAPAE